MICYLIKGELPWKLGKSLFQKDTKSKIKESIMLQYLVTFDDDFISIYKHLKSLETRV